MNAGERTVEQWAEFWRQVPPERIQPVIREQLAAGTEVAALAGLLRSTFADLDPHSAVAAPRDLSLDGNPGTRGDGNRSNSGIPLEEENPPEDNPPEDTNPLEETNHRGHTSPSKRVLPLGGSSKRQPATHEIPDDATMRGWEHDPRLAAAALGTHAAEGELVPCAVPDHGGEGWLERKPDGRFVYRCTCDRIERGLGEVYAGRISRVNRRRSRQEFVLWKIRLAWEAGLRELPPCPPLLPIPENCQRAITVCYQALELWLRCRARTVQRDESEFTFTRQFVSEWSSLTPGQVKDGIAGLRRFGVLVKTDSQIVTRAGREANSYRLGEARRPVNSGDAPVPLDELERRLDPNHRKSGARPEQDMGSWDAMR